MLKWATEWGDTVVIVLEEGQELGNSVLVDS
jgi:hypothetical protein